MKVEYFVLRQPQLDGQGRSDEEFPADPVLFEQVLRRRYCITSLCGGDGKVYIGCTNTSGDILHEFDVHSGRFRSLGFAKSAEPYDAKIHRGLAFDRGRRSLYFGLASLTPTSKVALCPGGRIVRFDLDGGTCHELGRPMPGNYIQATLYDPQRQMMYSFTEPSQGFAATELATGRHRRAMALGSLTHNSTLDNDGGVWGTWFYRGVHPFFRYDPDGDRFDFPEGLVMPTSAQACNLMYPGAGPVDCLAAGPDGLVYAASAMGELYRIDPHALTLEYLGRPVPHNRLPGLAFAPDGLLYGVGGNDGRVTLWSFDRRSSLFRVLGELAAPDGRRCFRPHDMICLAGRLFIAETDNPKASGCLWAVTV